MKSTIRYNFASALLTVSLAIAINPAGAFAQGSAGGSIGNDDKAVSGSRETPRAAEPSKPARRSKPEAEEPRRTSRKSGGGGSGGGNLDGAWVLTSVRSPCGTSSDTALSSLPMLPPALPCANAPAGLMAMASDTVSNALAKLYRMVLFMKSIYQTSTAFRET